MQIQPFAHCQDAQDCIFCYRVNFEEVVYVIRLYHSHQVFPVAEKQFLNQDHHKVQDSEVKPRYYPTTVGHGIIERKK